MAQNILKLNVGCGTKPLPGFVNIDVFDFPGIDVKHNLNQYPYPFDDGSADEILCSHVIEHLNDPDKCLTELHRMLKKGGKLTIRVPYFGHTLAFSSWQHKHYFAIASFAHLDKKSDLDWWTPVFSRVRTKVRFGTLYRYFPLTWISMLLITWYFPLYEDTFLRTLTPAAELEVTLIK